MAILQHSFDNPDRFVAGTVGRPGERSFFLQARQGNNLVSVLCEKQQVALLAEHLERMMDEVGKLVDGNLQLPPPVAVARDNDPLDAPIEEEFRVGTMSLGFDLAEERITIELFSVTGDAPEDEDEEDAAEQTPEMLAQRAEEVVRVRMTLPAVRDFIARANAVLSAGRPPCPFCGQPVNAGGHICPRANGYRRPLFEG
ncbi:DUF3090 domain-containing protein [Granulicoccus phenolivorans]|uniref:DUF3090 domain-containing protein n=1 Tax=Granulicoccus phenolivorans TaxID=266854 RepID=UPI00042741B7|nr:DUF3090 domain-containing protein [Granulicoccus phenolivorans]